VWRSVTAIPGRRSRALRLVACPECHTQFDVTRLRAGRFPCSCGAIVQNVDPVPVDAATRRCGSCGASVGPDATRCEYCDSTIFHDRNQLSLICPECYARNREESRFCRSCGVRFAPEPVGEDLPRLSCPCCRRPMESRSVGGVSIQECPSCNGLWVPGDHFDRLMDRAIESIRSRPSEGLGARRVPAPDRRPRSWKVEYRHCPVCGGMMQRKNFAGRSGVIVDWCGKDGTWLDADELEEIARFILSGGLAEATRAASGEGGPGHPASLEEREAMITAERLMAEERARERGRGSWGSGGFSRGDLDSPLRGLLQRLLGG
jgi:Zn-finger nucleic acid-binding protein/ribosomal protein L40E